MPNNIGAPHQLGRTHRPARTDLDLRGGKYLWKILIVENNISFPSQWFEIYRGCETLWGWKLTKWQPTCGLKISTACSLVWEEKHPWCVTLMSCSFSVAWKHIKVGNCGSLADKTGIRDLWWLFCERRHFKAERHWWLDMKDVCSVPVAVIGDRSCYSNWQTATSKPLLSESENVMTLTALIANLSSEERWSTRGRRQCSPWGQHWPWSWWWWRPPPPPPRHALCLARAGEPRNLQSSTFVSHNLTQHPRQIIALVCVVSCAEVWSLKNPWKDCIRKSSSLQKTYMKQVKNWKSQQDDPSSVGTPPQA